MQRRFLVALSACVMSIGLCSPSRADLVGLWRFDADVSPQPDSSGNNHDAEPMNDVTWVNDADRGGVMEFDGDTDYLEVEDTDLLSIEGELTIAAWANFVDFDEWNSIVGKTGEFETNKPAPYDLYTIQGGDARLRFYLGDGAGSLGFADSLDPLEAEQWQHIAVTIDEEGEVIHYIDGEENNVGFVDALRVDNDTNLFIGSRADFVTNMTGMLDDVAIFNQVLTEQQVGTIMSGDFSEFIGGGVAGDFDEDGALTDRDVDLLTAEIKAGTNAEKFDLNADQLVDKADHQIWVADLKKTWLGDVNLDGLFNSSDFVQAFTRGQYEDGVLMNSGWGDGDWTADQEFDSSDFVAAFTDGGYEMGERPAAAAIPEPTTGWMVLVAGWILCWRRRRAS